jgi:hypothetical protein
MQECFAEDRKNFFGDVIEYYVACCIAVLSLSKDHHLLQFTLSLSKGTLVRLPAGRQVSEVYSA